MASNEIVRVGIIGAGRIGKLHAENLAFSIRNVTPVVIIDGLMPVKIGLAAQRSLSRRTDR